MINNSFKKQEFILMIVSFLLMVGSFFLKPKVVYSEESNNQETEQMYDYFDSFKDSDDYEWNSDSGTFEVEPYDFEH